MIWNCLFNTEQYGLYFTDNISKYMFFISVFCMVYQIFTEVCSWGSNWQLVNIGSGDRLVPIRW